MIEIPPPEVTREEERAAFLQRIADEVAARAMSDEDRQALRRQLSHTCANVKALEDHCRRADLAGRALARRLERLEAAIGRLLSASCVAETESAKTAAREALGRGFLNCGCPTAAGVCPNGPICLHFRRCARHCYACKDLNGDAA